MDVKKGPCFLDWLIVVGMLLLAFTCIFTYAGVRGKGMQPPEELLTLAGVALGALGGYLARSRRAD